MMHLDADKPMLPRIREFVGTARSALPQSDSRPEAWLFACSDRSGERAAFMYGPAAPAWIPASTVPAQPCLDRSAREGRALVLSVRA